MGGSHSQRKHRPTMATTIEKLPDHLLSNILVRVPARTLAQMRSVSKPMNAFLSQPSFIQSHLHRSIKTNDETLLVFKDGVSSKVTAHPCRSPIWNSLISFNFLFMITQVMNCGYIVQICNPSISALLVVPRLVPSGGFLPEYRFGFDPKNDDYKLVRHALFVDQHEQPDERHVLVQVYSMRKRCWKLITERFPEHLAMFGVDKVCGDGHDGRLHWLCFHADDHNLEMIGAFDLGAETFSEIALPVGNMDRWNVLGVLGGKLCLMSCLKDHNCEVWLMNEYSHAESWAKLHVFSQFSANNMSPFGFTLSNEFLFTSSDVLSLYEPIAAKVKSFMFEVGRHAKVVPYVDSLVWITPDKHKKKRKRCMVPSKS